MKKVFFSDNDAFKKELLAKYLTETAVDDFDTKLIYALFNYADI